jgi:hypothetical protein
MSTVVATVNAHDAKFASLAKDMESMKTDMRNEMDIKFEHMQNQIIALQQRHGNITGGEASDEMVDTCLTVSLLSAQTDQKISVINAALEELKTSVATISRPPSTASGIASTWGTVATPRGASAAPADRRKLWVRGFPVKLMASAFDKHFEFLKTLLSPTYRDKCSAITKSCKYAYVIIFEDADDAKNALLQLRAMTLEWGDGSGFRHRLRVGTDEPIDIRKKGWVLGQVWQHIKQVMTDAGTWRPDSQLRCNKYMGLCFLVNGDLVDELVVLQNVLETDNPNVEPNRGNLKRYGFTDEQVDKLPELVTAALRRE